jgi:hypothetical protein
VSTTARIFATILICPSPSLDRDIFSRSCYDILGGAEIARDFSRAVSLLQLIRRLVSHVANGYEEDCLNPNDAELLYIHMSRVQGPWVTEFPCLTERSRLCHDVLSLSGLYFSPLVRDARRENVHTDFAATTNIISRKAPSECRL